MPNIGELAPNFTLLNQDGESINLSDYHGKKVLLFAFPRAGTSGCTTQACGFRDHLPQIEAENTVVLGISPDQPKDLLKWKQDEALQYDLLSDPDHEILEAWGAWGERSMYGRKFMGVIRSHWIIGEDGTVLDAQNKVSPKKSIETATKFLNIAVG